MWTPGAANTIYNNTFYGNQDGMWLIGAAAGANNNLVKNNISFGNTQYQLVAWTGMANDGVTGTGNVYAYNCFGPEATNFVYWDTGPLSTYDAIETAYGGTTASIEADPQFISTTNYHLKGSSPARRSGADLNLTTDFIGRPVHPTNPEIGAYQYSFKPLMRIGGKWR